MRWVVIVLLAILYGLNTFDKSMIGFTASQMMQEFGLSPVQWGVIGSSFFWVFTVMAIVGGALADRFGTRKLLIAMAIGWTVAQISMSFTTGLTSIILSRMLLGFFEGPFFAVAIRHTHKWTLPEMRSRAVSVVQMGAVVGGFAVAPITVWLIAQYGWRASYAIVGTVTIVWLMVYLLSERGQLANEINKLVPVKDRPKTKWTEVLPLFRHPTFIVLCLTSFVLYWYGAWSAVWLPIYFTEGLQVSTSVMSTSMVIKGVGSAIVALGFAWVVDRLFKKFQSYRKAHAVTVGILVWLAGVLLFSMAIFPSLVWVVLVLLIASAINAFFYNMGSAISTQLAPDKGGFLVGTFVAVGGLGASIGPIINGKLIAMTGADKLLGFNYGLYLFAVLLFLFGICILLFVYPDRKQVHEETTGGMVGDLQQAKTS